MKIFSFILFVFVSFQVIAITPKIGHEVILSHEFSIMGASFKGVRGKSIAGFKESTNEFEIFFHSKYGAMSSDNTGLVHSILVNRTYIKDTLSFCENLPETTPGEIEKITTKAGTFLTCKVDYSMEAGFIYYKWHSSEVPFGIVRKYDEYPDGDYNFSELIEYKI